MSILAASLGLVRALPAGLAGLAGRLIVLCYLVVFPRVRREIERNHVRVFGQRRAGFWLRQAWRLGANLALMSRSGHPSLDKLLDNARIDGENILEQIMLRNERAVVLSLHYGVWELLPETFARRGYQVCVGAGSQLDARFGTEILQLRTQHGVRYTDSLDEMREALKSGSLVGFAVDNTSRGRGVGCSSVWPGFEVLRTPFVLAQEQGAALVPVLMRREGRQLSAKVGLPVRSPEEFGNWARREIATHPEDWVFWGKREAVA
jgi:lauroyl/myristoyl acyltransferase